MTFEPLACPTLGPLLELGVVNPLNAIAARAQGKQTHFLAREFQDVKGFFPGGNAWYAKAAMDHLVWQQVMEALSPGYLSTMRQKTMKDTGQDWWWRPGDVTPERAPDFGQILK